MKKIFTFILSAFMCTLVFGQRQEAVIAKAGDVKPVIDGVVDDVWQSVEKLTFQNWGTEKPSIGDAGTSYFKTIWDDKGLYILIFSNDDVWYPYSGTGNAYEYDKIELYFDTNYVLEDGVGGQGGSSGNRQIAPDPTLDKLNGEKLSQTILGGSVNYAFKVENPAWTTEWFIPWESIPDKDGGLFDKTAPMGFDVQITDNDNDGAGRKRAIWSNTATFGAKNENWNNMDDAGHVTLDGVGASVDITSIAVTGGNTITTDNGTVQLTAAILPADYTQAYKWKITQGADIATIDKDGLVKAVKNNGTVKVKAFSADEFVSSNEITITITGQKVTMDEINLFKDGNFDQGVAGVDGWGINGGFSVVDGWFTVDCTPKTNIWDAMAYQVVKVDATTKYFVRFKAKASQDMMVPFIIEDINNNYNKALTSSSPWRGTENWQIPVTTEAKWFEFDVIHSAFVDNSKYQPSFQVGMLSGTLSVDSISMYSEADKALLSTAAKSISANSMKVYPNPVGSDNQLYVSCSSMNTKVAIYNAIGQKMMEKVTTGNIAHFNVSSLTKGMYMVKLSDGTTQKFVK